MHLPKVTRNLLWIIALVYLAQQFLGDALMPFMLWPFGDVFVGTGSDGVAEGRQRVLAHPVLAATPVRNAA